jgi:hypothetical protein
VNRKINVSGLWIMNGKQCGFAQGAVCCGVNTYTPGAAIINRDGAAASIDEGLRCGSRNQIRASLGVGYYLSPLRN